MPGTSAKTAEVKLRVPVDMAATIETYAQAHTHGNKTKAYLHFIEVGINSESDNAPITKADLLAVAAATQATIKQTLAQQQLPALPSAEDIGKAVGTTVESTMARQMANTTDTIASQIAKRLPTVESIKESESRVDREFMRGFLAGKEAEDRRALAIALNMKGFRRSMCGLPFIREFLPDKETELMAEKLPQDDEYPADAKLHAKHASALPAESSATNNSADSD